MQNLEHFIGAANSLSRLKGHFFQELALPLDALQKLGLVLLLTVEPEQLGKSAWLKRATLFQTLNHRSV
jgi:hypothetical protein